MKSIPRATRDLLRQLINSKTEEEEKELVSNHPEIESYYLISDSVLRALSGVMSIVAYQLWEVESFDEFQEFSEDKLFAEIMRKTDNPQLVVDAYLTIQSALKYPDYLTEESYWLVAAIDSGIYAKFYGQCEWALRFCLENGFNKTFVIKLLDERNSNTPR
jgi:hypothetical protein